MHANAPLEVRDGMGGGALVGDGAIVEEEEAVEATEDLELGLWVFRGMVDFICWMDSWVGGAHLPQGRD